jgi:hypothetical protein
MNIGAAEADVLGLSNQGMEPTPSSVRSAPAFGRGSCLAFGYPYDLDPKK